MSESTININGTTTFICDCEGTAPIDIKKMQQAFPDQDIKPATQLCGKQLSLVEKHLQAGDDKVVVACTHMSSVFSEMAEQFDREHELQFTNIRERAAWSKQVDQTGPKIAALLAEASLITPDTGHIAMESDGSVLVFGDVENAQTALDAARQLSDRLHISLILAPESDVILSGLYDFPIYSGTPTSARGHLGDFTVAIAGLTQADPASRGKLTFKDKPQDGSAECSLILDLRSGAPLVTAPDKRDGYFNPDPASVSAVQRILYDMTDMVGEFDKPLYVTYRADICAHSKSGIVGCTRCMDLCPAGAIKENDGEDFLTFDPNICAGCGSCAASCPTGAVTYNLPDNGHLLRRLRLLSSTYNQAGGSDACLFVYDVEYGEEMVAIIARHGDGLPANVIPFAVNQTTQFGLEPAFAAIAYGFKKVICLVNPAHQDEQQGLIDTTSLVNQMLAGLGYGDEMMSIMSETDPDQVSSILYDLNVSSINIEPASFEPSGDKASLIRSALRHLNDHAPTPMEIIDLPVGAPFGTLDINVEKCTLCLSCVGACPTNALSDNPDMPQLRFRESACIQCGLCKATCPESVIDLVAQYNFTSAALNMKTIKEEEPFECIKCGTPFGSKSMIENMTAKLEGHSMFSKPVALDRLKMCDNCRVISIAEDEEQPFFAGLRPKPRTTEDYLSGKISEDDPFKDGQE